MVPGDRIADKVTFEWSYHSISCIVRYLMSRTNRAVACDPRTRLNIFYTEGLERLRRRQQSCCYREVSSAVSLLLGSDEFTCEVFNSQAENTKVIQ